MSTRKTFLSLAITCLLLALSGCRTFSHYVWISGAAPPEFDGTWVGPVVPVTLYDGDGNPFPVPAAGLTIAGGKTTFRQDSGMPFNQPGGTYLLSRDGDHALPYSDFAPGTWLEVTGTTYPEGRYPLKAPDSETWVDTRAEAKRGGYEHPSWSYPANTGGVAFLQFQGKPRKVPAQTQPTSAPAPLP